MHKLIATGFGIGYIRKGSGTVAAALCCIIWYFTGGGSPVAAGLIALVITATGVWSANHVERYWGVDNNRVVIDEIAGMCISLLFLPVTRTTVVAALVLFRFFDIVKPLYIRKAEKLPGGWGVMADDLLAGIYTNILLQIAVKFSLI
jgi:phosphatidylglycerophosphatase A